MPEFTFRRRHRLKDKEFRKLIARPGEVFEFSSIPPEMERGAVDRAKGLEYDVLIVNNEIFFLVDGDVVFPTVRGILALEPTKRYVTVDMGAVPYVYNGADIMAPGIVDADGGVKVNDHVWVRDMKNLKPLAVGLALLSGPEMVHSRKGKAIRTIHYIGDSIWNA